MKGSDTKLNKDEFVLALMAAADGDAHQPVQIQKLLFLADDKIGSQLGGPFFHFRPYDYGPFDSDVYHTLERLEVDGKVEIIRGGWAKRTYRLTAEGQRLGEGVMGTLRPGTGEYMKALSAWVRSLSFSELVSAVYKAYPDMRENSVFVEC